MPPKGRPPKTTKAPPPPAQDLPSESEAEQAQAPKTRAAATKKALKATTLPILANSDSETDVPATQPKPRTRGGATPAAKKNTRTVDSEIDVFTDDPTLMATPATLRRNPPRSVRKTSEQLEYTPAMRRMGGTPASRMPMIPSPGNLQPVTLFEDDPEGILRGMRKLRLGRKKAEEEREGGDEERVMVKAKGIKVGRTRVSSISKGLGVGKTTSKKDGGVGVDVGVGGKISKGRRNAVVGANINTAEEEMEIDDEALDHDSEIETDTSAPPKLTPEQRVQRNHALTFLADKAWAHGTMEDLTDKDVQDVEKAIKMHKAEPIPVLESMRKFMECQIAVRDACKEYMEEADKLGLAWTPELMRVGFQEDSEQEGVEAGEEGEEDKENMVGRI